MAVRGERFLLNLSDDEGDDFIPISSSSADPSTSLPLPTTNLIGEIRERTPTTAVPPAPKPPTGTTGFPQHRQRVRTSAFKQRRAAAETTPSLAPSHSARPGSGDPTAKDQSLTEQDEKRLIHEENQRLLASMSSQQVEKERAELMESMEPSLLERFLRRARIDDDGALDTPASLAAKSQAQLENSLDKKVNDTSKSSKPVSLVLPSSPVTGRTALSQPTLTATDKPLAPLPFNEDAPPSTLPGDLHPASETPVASFHFPTPPPRSNPMPNLDPTSPTFLSDLQAHYFPEISHDPSSLSWLQPQSADPEDPDSSRAYHPASSAVSVSPSAFRFSLIGSILSPATSLSLPTNLGLHHHGEDPQAAGYTIPELAILSRSTFPAQRCIAWQVIGRILFRLGKGEFGERGSPLVDGLWDVIEREGVVAGMLAEADGLPSDTGTREKGPLGSAEDTSAQGQEDSEAKSPTMGRGPGIGRHASATAWAVEGVWLWQIGGGGDRGLLKEGVRRSQ